MQNIRIPPNATIALIGKYNAQGILEPLRAIAAMLLQRGHTVLVDQATAQHGDLSQCTPATLDEIGQRAQLAVVVGGDGTLLGIARQLAPHAVPLIGINQGRLGFMTDIPLAQANQALQSILDGQYEAEQRTMLHAQVVRDEQEIFASVAVNDVVVSRGSNGGLVELSVAVNGQPMTTQRADGLIVATPTGSTAYALSASGPILHPQLAGLLLVPIAPHALTNRPIALPDDSHIEITIRGGRAISAHFDMQSYTEIQEGDRIRVQRSHHHVRLLHPVGYNYFAMLREKLHWNTSPLLDAEK
ncbi:MAG: NAD kinase [Burkholderiaceae bacterium]|nr:MAG: NAD kinase [Burkholderiaceae bacterium]